MLRFRPRTHTAGWGRTVLRLLPALGLLLVIWACSGRVGRMLPTPTPRITHLPGSQLRLEIEVSGQYSDQKHVQVFVRIFDGPSVTDYALLAPGAKLTCNGTDIKPTTTVYALSGKACPRQPPGGSYTITLTDEHGVPASVVVPAPSGALSIVTPRAGSKVAIPPGRPFGVLRVAYNYSRVPLNSTVLVNSIVATCGTASNTCGNVNSEYHYPPFATPEPVTREDAPTPTPIRGVPTPTLPPGPQPPTPTPYPVAPTPMLPDGQAYATPGPDGGPALGTCAGAIVKNKPLGPCTGVYDISGDFSTFHPGPGSVSVNVEIHTPSLQGGFAAASCAFTGIIATAPITWTRA